MWELGSKTLPSVYYLSEPRWLHQSQTLLAPQVEAAARTATVFETHKLDQI